MKRMSFVDFFKEDYKKWSKRITKDKLKRLATVEEIFKLKGTARVLFVLSESKNLRRSRRLRLIDFTILTDLPQSVIKKSLDHLVYLKMIDKKLIKVKEPRKEKVITYELREEGKDFIENWFVWGNLPLALKKINSNP